MLHRGFRLIGLLLPCAAAAQAPVPTSPIPKPSIPVPAALLHASYDTYAAGLRVAEVETGFGFTPAAYQMSQVWRTTGVVGWLFRGHQFNQVSGFWRDGHAVPQSFVGRGEWRGEHRSVEIEYRRETPVVRQLVPPVTDEREPVPQSLRDNSIDTLSALAQLLHVVATTGRCETGVQTYDGRRAVVIEAHTAGAEQLQPTSRSSFAGRALRCDFSGRMLAGFKITDDRARAGQPMHGSAWMATAVAGEPPLPVRLAFQTRGYGDAVMYLTGAGRGPGVHGPDLPGSSLPGSGLRGPGAN